MEKILNAVGWRCPKPIIETKKCLDEMEKGTVTTIVDNAEAVENLTVFSGNSGYEISHRKDKDLYYVTIEKSNQSEDEQKAYVTIEESSRQEATHQSNDIVVFITSNVFGEGDRELGETLMKSYIYALTEVDPKPRTLIFINSGVTLTTEGTPVAESLETLVNEGVEILSCGACLNYYGLAEKLIAGSISNMYTIVEKINSADKAIKI